MRLYNGDAIERFECVRNTDNHRPFNKFTVSVRLAVIHSHNEDINRQRMSQPTCEKPLK